MTQPSPSHRRGAVAVIHDAERFLVIRRSRLVVAPGKYCFPGGGIEAGETEAEALVREMQEELNLTVRPVKRVWRSTTLWGVDLAWWSAALPPGCVPVANPREVESIHWMTPASMATLEDLLESARDFLTAWEAGEIVLE